MFSLYRRDLTPPIINEDGSENPDGKHLTFCMAPEDILIRNSVSGACTRITHAHSLALSLSLSRSHALSLIAPTHTVPHAK